MPAADPLQAHPGQRVKGTLVASIERPSPGGHQRVLAARTSDSAGDEGPRDHPRRQRFESVRLRTSDQRWDDDVLQELGVLTGAHMEVVDASSLMAHPDSGQVR